MSNHLLRTNTASAWLPRTKPLPVFDWRAGDLAVELDGLADTARGLRPLLERLGWAKQGFGLHSFRRSYVSALIANGLDVANVSKYAGHASPTITLDRYAREFEARKRDDDRVREVTAGLWSATAEH